MEVTCIDPSIHPSTLNLNLRLPSVFRSPIISTAPVGRQAESGSIRRAMIDRGAGGLMAGQSEIPDPFPRDIRGTALKNVSNSAILLVQVIDDWRIGTGSG
jgi:hypothetical protein